MGEGPTSRESPYHVSCTFEALAKQNKTKQNKQTNKQTKSNASAQGSLKFRKVSNSFWEGARREKTRLKKLVTHLLSYLLTYLVSY